VNPEENVSFRAVALGLPNARLWWTGNPIRKGELWVQKRSRAARLGGVAGVRPVGETLVDKARSRSPPWWRGGSPHQIEQSVLITYI